MKRALGCAFALLLAACAPRSGTTNTPRSDVVMPGVELLVSALPHGRSPKLPVDPPKDLARTDRIDGIHPVPIQHVIFVSGLYALPTPSDTTGVIDPPGTSDAYCVNVLNPDPSWPDRPALLSRAMAARDRRNRFRAERLEPGTPQTGGASTLPEPTLRMLTGWADDVGGARMTNESVSPMRRIAQLGGVEVFAFVDDAAPATVHLVVRRPPVRAGRVAVPFAAILLDGTVSASACGHARLTLPLARGNGATATLRIGIETETGARDIKLHASTLWLAGEPEARVTARLEWYGVEVPYTRSPEELRRF